MKRLSVCLYFFLMACSAPQSKQIDPTESGLAPLVLEEPVFAAPAMIVPCQDIGALDGDGIGGTGCPSN